MPHRRSRHPIPFSFLRSRPSIERLEDRTVPTVGASLAGGVLTVTLDANDSATITGTDASGTSIDVKDNTTSTTQSFTGVTDITVSDSGTNAGQSVAFNDGGAGTKIAISGAIQVSGIESVSLATVDAALAAGSLAVSGAATTIEVDANVTTTGAAGQSYDGPVSIGNASITLDAGAAGDIAFLQSVDSVTSGAASLTLDAGGATTFAGAVGAAHPLQNLFTDSAGTTLIKGNISAVNVLTFNDPVTVSGAAITLASTGNGTITFNSTVDDDSAGTTALTLNAGTGVTSFAGDVGALAPLASIATDAGSGGTVFGTSSLVDRKVSTTGNQTYSDAVRLNAASVVFSASLNGDITFANTLNGTSGVQTDTAFNTGGATNFTGLVGGTVPLKSLTTDSVGTPGGTTTIAASVTTTADQDYKDVVSFAPGTGITNQNINSTIGNVTFEKALGGSSAAPVSISAGVNVAFGGNATFTASGSRLNVKGGAGGAGTFAIGAGLQFQADTQVWQAGDGAGGLGASTGDLLGNSPAFRDSTGTNAPRAFAYRQDAAIADADIPAVAQFGAAPPANYSIISDDSTLTLNSTTALAGPGTTNLTLASASALSLGASINAPMGIVRLRSLNANITQTGGGITAAGLGVKSANAIALTGANAVTGPFAAQASASNIQFANGSAYTVGNVGADPLNLIFPSVSGVAAAGGTVSFAQPGSSPLGLTIAASVSGTSVTATGGTGDDRVTVNYTAGGQLPNGLAFTGGGGNDTLALSDAGGTTAHTYTLGSTAVRDSNAPLTYSGVKNVTATGGTAADTFNVTPDATAAITVTGGLPTGATGDAFTLTLGGAGSPALTATKAADGFSGSATFSDRGAVSFSQMESITPQADIQTTSSVDKAFVPVGSAATITVVVTNAGPAGTTGVALDDAFPASTTGTWTAVASNGSTVAAASGTGDIHTTADLAANGTVTFTIVLTPNAGFKGTVSNTFAASAGSSAFDATPDNNQATSSFTVEALDLTVVGAGAGGGPQVRVFNSDGTQRFSFFAYETSYTGGVTVASGDVNGDGIEDIVTGSAQDSSHVKVFDGATGALLASFFAFPGFTGGVNVAVAHGEVIVGAGPGGGPVFAGYTIAGGAATQVFSQFAFESTLRGGVSVAGTDDLISVGAGPGGNPRVIVYDAATLVQVSSFFAFPTNYPNGLNLGMGTAGGRDTVIAGLGDGGIPVVATLDARTGQVVNSVQAFDSSVTGGVRTASTTTASGEPATVVGAGPGGAPRVRILAADGTAVLDFFAFDSSFRGGVYVG